MTDPKALWHAGDLAALRAHYTDRVRAEPAKATHRLDLADVLILQGELDRADAQLDIAAGQDLDRAVMIALTRQLVRAAIARNDCFEQRRPPELVAPADTAITAALSRLAGLEEADADMQLTGTIDGQRFDGLRDGDDRTAGILELLTTTGKYVWISLAQIVSLAPAKPKRPRDLAWRRADLEVRDGPSGVVYLPAIYHATAMSDAQRLGRETDWVEHGEETWGVGLRTFLAGEDAAELGSFNTLAVDA